MSESKIRRKNKSFDVTLNAATSDSSTIVLSDMAGGIVTLGTHNTNATELAVWVASDSAGPFRALRDKSGTAVKVTTRVRLLPATRCPTRCLRPRSSSCN